MDLSTRVGLLREALPETGAAAPAAYRMGLGRACPWPDDPERAAHRRALLVAHPTRLAARPDVAVGQACVALGRAGQPFEAVALEGPDDVFVATRTGLVVAHAIALPSGYAPEHTLGASVTCLHGRAPGLSETLPGIPRMLAELPVGRVLARTNLGLAPAGALDRHPAHARPCEPPLEGLDVRLELQSFEGLPDGVLFRIRIVHLPVASLDPETRTRLVRYVAALPPDVAAYKGLASLRTNGGSSS